MNGWVKIHRRMLENPVCCKDTEYLAVWIFLLLNAAHTETPFLFNGKKIMLQAGQLVTCKPTIAQKLGISESKIFRILTLFESEQQIEQQITRHGRLITLLSWAEYQEDERQTERQLNDNRTTTERQVNANKNIKNVRTKEVKNKDLKELPEKKNFADLVTLTDEEYKKIVAKVGGETEAAELIEILNNYKASSGKKYKSDYFTLLGWPLDRYNENLEKKARRSVGGYSGSKKQNDILGEIAKARNNFDEGV